MPDSSAYPDQLSDSDQTEPSGGRLDRQLPNGGRLWIVSCRTPDSYGYRPGRSALDALGTCRKRCWKLDWVIALGLRAFFDSIDHDLMLKAVSKHTDLRWVLLYVIGRGRGPVGGRSAGPGTAPPPRPTRCLEAKKVGQWSYGPTIHGRTPALGRQRYGIRTACSRDAVLLESGTDA